MTSGIVQTVGTELFIRRNASGYHASNYTDTVMDLKDIPLDIRIQVAVAVTLAVGIWQALMGILRIGYLAVFLSDHLVKGFTCAAAFHVFTSQVSLVFGMKNLKQRNGPLKLVYFYYDFFAQIMTVHVPTLIISCVCIVLLYLTRVMINQNSRVMKIIKIPFPMELIVIIFATLISYYMDLEGAWGVSIVKNIPTGLPAPHVPYYAIIPDILGRTFALSVVASSVLISLAKIFATKHRYKVSANQELIANGAGNIFGSFFLCIPTTGALARSAVQEAVGGATQLVSLVSAVIILVVLLALGKFLNPLPRACLGAIIMVALINMLKGVLEVKKLWKVSLIDASIFMVTLLATLLLDVDYGLAIGVLYSLLTFAFRMQYGKVSVLGKVRGTEDEVRPVEDPTVDEFAGARVFRLYGPLYSGNAEAFISKIRRAMTPVPGAARVASSYLTPVPEAEIPVEPASNGSVESNAGFEPDLEANAHTGVTRRPSTADQRRNVSTVVDGDGIHAEATSLKPLSVIVIDCSTINFVDVVGAENLQSLGRECKKKEIKLALVNCSEPVYNTLVLSGILSFVPRDNFYKSVTEAVEHLLPSDHDRL
ncbi:hypothetical protein RvY_04814 [Ramazzottius varieornatus]|uniref:STAS domain-containing protein n=1 Tax=Ramazzottius varieornatus TaxID=947166 RepID=A0A1D1USW1_RAMVA|nr:hypothetical protein RvY_04814 [Ramazzottius varieornatus]